MKIFVSIRRIMLLMILVSYVASLNAQTDLDYDMMAKNVFCTGLIYSHSSWDHYWEGNFKRNNANLGTVSTQMLGLMSNYGVSKKINIIFSLPYVKTHASGGTMSGMEGLQDLSLFVKWKPLTMQAGAGKWSFIGVGGVSFPASTYVADYLPLALGLRSKTLILRAIADYQLGKFSATGSGTYLLRSNIDIDRTSYYTTEMHLTNEVQMPNAASFHVRTGYRSKYLRAEAVVNHFTTLSGFDISKNNMPFPSNKMEMTTAGISLRYIPNGLPRFHLTAEGNYTVAGRNVGQATSFAGGAFYIFNFNRKKHSAH